MIKATLFLRLARCGDAHVSSSSRRAESNTLSSPNAVSASPSAGLGRSSADSASCQDRRAGEVQSKTGANWSGNGSAGSMHAATGRPERWALNRCTRTRTLPQLTLQACSTSSHAGAEARCAVGGSLNSWAAAPDCRCGRNAQSAGWSHVSDGWPWRAVRESEHRLGHYASWPVTLPSEQALGAQTLACCWLCFFSYSPRADPSCWACSFVSIALVQPIPAVGPLISLLVPFSPAVGPLLLFQDLFDHI